MTSWPAQRVVARTVLVSKPIPKCSTSQRRWCRPVQKPLHWVREKLLDIKVLYDDEALVAVYKPSGVLVHQTQGLKEPTLAGWVKKHTGQVPSYPIYRLDRATSGIVLFAKQKENARWLNENPPKKYYLLATRGRAPLSGLIDHALPNRKGTERIPSQTRYRRMGCFQMGERQFSWVLAKPITGRIHQIRQHFKHISHPLLGDVKYGKGAINQMFQVETGLNRLMLHARTIIFQHPAHKTTITLKAEFLEAEQQALAHLTQF